MKGNQTYNIEVPLEAKKCFTLIKVYVWPSPTLIYVFYLNWIPLIASFDLSTKSYFTFLASMRKHWNRWEKNIYKPQRQKHSLHMFSFLFSSLWPSTWWVRGKGKPGLIGPYRAHYYMQNGSLFLEVHIFQLKFLIRAFVCSMSHRGLKYNRYLKEKLYLHCQKTLHSPYFWKF